MDTIIITVGVVSLLGKFVHIILGVFGLTTCCLMYIVIDFIGG